MERRIIELTKVEPNGACLICCEKKATVDVRINRFTSYIEDVVTTFHVCDECLAKMQKDIEVCK